MMTADVHRMCYAAFCLSFRPHIALCGAAAFWSQPADRMSRGGKFLTDFFVVVARFKVYSIAWAFGIAYKAILRKMGVLALNIPSFNCIFLEYPETHFPCSFKVELVTS